MAVGGMLFGLDTGCIGPVTTMAQFEEANGSLSAIVHGLVVSSILIPAAMTSFIAGPLADKVGRTKAVMVGAIAFALGTALEAAAQDLAMLIVGRVIAGIGRGFFLATTVVYICEIVPANHRGPLASLVQMVTTLGICTGYFICTGSTHLASSLSWRIPFIFQTLLSASLAAACPFLPPSPRWMISAGRIGEVPALLDRLGLSPAAFAQETSTLAQTTPSSARGFSNLALLFAPGSRGPASFAAFLLAMAQFTGIDGVLYYAPILFRQAGLSSASASFLASGVSALLIFAVTVPACALADRFSRRASTMAACMFLIGAVYAARAGAGAGRWAVVVAIYLFAAVYAVTWAVVFKIYVSEIQPARTRAAAAALAQSANWAANFVVALTTPVLLARSSYAAYFLFGGCGLLTAVVCFVFMPETRGMALDSIAESFVLGDGPRGSTDAAVIRDTAVELAAVDDVRSRAVTAGLVRGRVNESDEGARWAREHVMRPI